MTPCNEVVGVIGREYKRGLNLGRPSQEEQAWVAVLVGTYMWYVKG
jgi:hypothetical protein